MGRYRLVLVALTLAALPFSVTLGQSGQGPVTCSGHTDKLWAVAFAPDGKLLASAGVDGTIRIWGATSGKEFDVLKGPKRLITCLAFSPKSNLLAAGIGIKGKPGSIEIWDLKKGEIKTNLAGHKGAIAALAFSSDGALLASGAADNHVKLWNVDTGKETRSVKGHSDTVSAVAFAPDGQTLASGSLDRKIKLWDVELKEKAVLEENPAWVLALAFSADGKTLAAGGGILFKVDVPSKILLWDLAKRKPRATLEGHKDSVTALVFRKQDQSWASSSMDKTIKLWSDASGKEMSTLTGHEGPVLSLAVSPDGKRLASASWDKTVKIWSVGNK